MKRGRHPWAPARGRRAGLVSAKLRRLRKGAPPQEPDSEPYDDDDADETVHVPDSFEPFGDDGCYRKRRVGGAE